MQIGNPSKHDQTCPYAGIVSVNLPNLPLCWDCKCKIVVLLGTLNRNYDFGLNPQNTATKKAMKLQNQVTKLQTNWNTFEKWTLPLSLSLFPHYTCIVNQAHNFENWNWKHNNIFSSQIKIYSKIKHSGQSQGSYNVQKYSNCLKKTCLKSIPQF